MIAARFRPSRVAKEVVRFDACDDCEIPEDVLLEVKRNFTRPQTVARVVWRAVSVALFLTAVIVWAVFFRPQTLGGPMSMLAVNGHSMDPTFHAGDFLMVRHIDYYHEGDIIVYRIPADEPGAGERVVHRIVGGDAETGFIMKGDNNANVDQWRPKHSDIVGEVWLRVPRLANFLMYFRDPKFLALTIGLVTFALLLFPDRMRTSLWQWIRK